MNSIAIIILSLKIVAGFDIDCSYRTDSVWDYGCDVKSINFTYGSDCRTGKIIGQHDEEKSNDDVKFINITLDTLKLLPRGLHKKFPNLEILYLNTIKLNQITRDDLKSFGNKLKILSIVKSSILNIDKNLFNSTRNVKFLHIESPKMENIHDKAFDPVMENLESLAVNFPCVGHQVEDKKEKIIKLIEKIAVSCFVVNYTSVISERVCMDDKSDENYWEIYKYIIIVFVVAASIGLIAFLIVYLSPDSYFSNNDMQTMQSESQNSFQPQGCGREDATESASHEFTVTKMKTFENEEFFNRN